MEKLCLLLLFLTMGGNWQASTEGTVNDKETCLCAQGACDVGWVQYKNACYKRVDVRVSWPEAEATCLSYDSHLAAIHSSEENDFVFVLMGKPQNHHKGECYWIGGHDTFREGDYMWTDGSKMTFKIFGAGQPDDLGNEDYIGSWYPENGHVTWNDYPSQYSFPFVCKYNLGNRMCSSEWESGRINASPSSNERRVNKTII